MTKIYLDNAATTPLDERVLEHMLPYLKEQYGNPSSIHGYGRSSRTLIEKSRRKIADLLNVSPAEIFFTSGGTESDNTVLMSNVLNENVSHIITSPVEHHAVLHTVEYISAKKWAQVSMVALDNKGAVDLENLRTLCAAHPNSLVSLMHANNEIGNLLNLDKVVDICKEFECKFHSDTVQTVGQIPINLKTTEIDYIVGSAHKFYGPKGIGFLYTKQGLKPYIHGGAQERNVRGGTENLHGIIGIAKALELALAELEESHKHVSSLKSKLIELLKSEIPDVIFNGNCEVDSQSLAKIVSITLPKSQNSDLILFNLDIEGIYVSGGSACTSGSLIGSHVLNAIHPGSENTVIRFSLSKFNTEAEINYAVQKLKEIYSN